MYENWVTSDTQKNKLKVTLCALNIYFLFPLFFIDTWHSSRFPFSWTYLSFPWELSLFCKCTHHHLSCLFIWALITLFHLMFISYFFLHVKAVACWVIQYISLFPDTQSIFQYFLQQSMKQLSHSVLIQGLLKCHLPFQEQ